MTTKYKLLTALSVILLVLSVLAAILYEKGFFDFTFIDRPVKENPAEQSETEEEETDAPPTETSPDETSEEPPETLPSLDNTDNIKKTYKEVVNAIPTVNDLRINGYRRSNEIFDGGRMALARLETPGITYNYSNSTETLVIPEKRPNFVGGYTTYLVTAEVSKPAIKLYMGLIMYDDAVNGHILLNSDFQGIYRRFDAEVYKPAYFRDGSDPVFHALGAYYYIGLGGDKPVFVDISTPDDIDFRPRWDVPQYYFPSGKNVHPYYDNNLKLWGYRNELYETTIEPQFFAAYEFNDNGLAAVVTQANKLVFINENGEVRIEKSGKVFYRNQRNAILSYFPPDTYGMESFGMFYFNHGLVRVRFHVHDDKEGESYVLDDYDILINAAGQEYTDIPVGFKISSYSDGIILLEKNGLYGYYDLHQKWVAQPKYTYATPFVEGVAVVGYEDGKKALIDTNGNVLLDLVFDYISMPSDGVIAAFESNNGWTVYHKMSR